MAGSEQRAAAGAIAGWNAAWATIVTMTGTATTMVVASGSEAADRA